MPTHPGWDPGQWLIQQLADETMRVSGTTLLFNYMTMRNANTQRPRALQRFKSYSHSQSQSHLREPDRHSTGSGGGKRERERDQRLHLLHQAAIDARAAKTIESSLYLLPDFTPYMP
ncbi:conserved hypothetical protein [Histoplasma capsulatum var. duboisii H88]|uniref:Uncharacterized protein n=1 Tax=Ajellomyces capsulatus (strain H88) TaxID=544711 RepID=F0UI48_AJEC8|nr:conserved hypothetical protein [Histoplasma capsulatum var. duboisii H88]